MELRTYQHQALDAIEKGWDEFRRQLLVLPTGTGKTIVFSHLAARESSRGRHTLILAHRDELLQQAQDKLKAATGLSSALEKADSRAYELFGDGLFATTPHVVVGSVQTLGNGRLTRWPKDTFDLVVVDEAHHVLSDSYRRIVDHFDPAEVARLLLEGGITSSFMAPTMIQLLLQGDLGLAAEKLRLKGLMYGGASFPVDRLEDALAALGPVLVQGYGFPRWQGGPVFWAREQPREALEAELEALAAITGHGARRGDAGLLLSA